MCVCVCVCLSSLVCMVGVVFVYIDMIYEFLWVFFFMPSWMFQHDYLDAYCFECLRVSYNSYACIFIFAPVQRS